VIHRVFALLLTLVVTAAPLSQTLCRVECAQAAGGRAHAAVHPCHEAAVPALTFPAVPQS
jgi:hypothetical protein